MTNNRLLDILSYIACKEGPSSPLMIAKHLNIPVSSVYRYLSVLKKNRFIVDAKEKGGYVLGAIALQMANNFSQNNGLLDIAKPEMLRLSVKTKETVALMVPCKLQAICVELVESQHALRCSFSVGKGTPLNKGATAKTLLAFMDKQEALQAIKYNQNSLDDVSVFLAELRSVKKQGFGTSQGEVDEGIWGISAPIINKNRLLGVITTMCPAMRAEGREADLIEATRSCTKSIMEYLTL
ncbi:IclR family transcriptional regulator [Thorsellia kenyensis]|uniref:HTH-type transcriptional repressor AllR n=1 Tax=Thorsellia kenyensis TaxID=1549888 RepID=A0ABV6C8M4_9GAMM